MQVRRSYLDTRFGQAHLRIVRPSRQDAMPLLCLPPQPLSGRMLEPLLVALGRKRLAAAADLPGFGASDSPTAPASLEDYLGWIDDVARGLGLDRYAALGWLTGGRFVVPLAARFPSVVPRIVLVGAPVADAAQHALPPPPPVPVPRRDGSHLLSEWSKWLGWWPEDVAVGELSDAFADTLQGLGRAERARILEVTRTIRHEDWLPQVSQPVLVINPSGPMHAATARAAPLLRNGRVVDTAPAMFPLLSAAHVAEAARLIDAFLDQDSPGTGN